MNVLNKKGDFVIYNQEKPFYHVEKILSISKKNPVDSNKIKQDFSWSIDNKVYSSWIDMTNENLYNLVLDPNNPLYLKFKYTLLIDNTLDIDISDLEFILDYKSINKADTFIPKFIQSEYGNIACSVIQNHNLCFKPYDVNPAICLHEQLSYMVNEMFGHEVEYYRAVPIENGRDVVLMEYTLYNVSAAKCVKVVVPDNEFPDNSMTYNPFGVEFEIPFEVHIDKNYWEGIFGDNTGPQKKDIIYFPLMNKVYEVMSSILFRAFMERDTYWKVSLIKYSPSSNRYESQDIRNTLDTLTTSAYKEFEDELREIEEDIVKPQQYDYNIGSKKMDPIRETLDPNIKIIEYNLKNYSTLLSEFHYNFKNLAINSEIAVTYRENVNDNKTGEISYCAWISPTSPITLTKPDFVTLTENKRNNNNVEYILSSSINTKYKDGDTLKLSRQNAETLYANVTNIDNNKVYINDNVINTYKGLDFTAYKYKCERVNPINLLNGLVENKGIKLDIIAHRFINVIINDEIYEFSLNKDLEIGKWYGIIINISKTFRQINVNIWERQWVEDVANSPQTTSLINIYTETKNNISINADKDNEYYHDYKYNIIASNTCMTNIRLFNKTIEFEKQENLLNQNIVTDASKAIIIDNAMPILRLPYMGQTK